MIRQAQITDAAACLAIYNPYIENTMVTFEEEALSLSAFEERMKTIMARWPWLVYEEEGKVLGYAYLSAFNPRSAYDWVADLAIYVDMNAHGRGIGTQLMQAISRLAEEDGYMWLVSIVTQGNRASEAIHERTGFEKKASFADFGYKMGRWVGVDYYVKQLRPLAADPRRPANKAYE